MFKYVALIITGAWLTACGGGGSSDSGPTRFVEQPRDQTVAVGASATFTASFAGEAPLSINWTRGGIPIPGATSTTYVTPPVTATDDGLTFGLALTVPGTPGHLLIASGPNILLSYMATLTVVPPPPAVQGVFTAAGTMVRPRYWHTATLLLNGKVLLVGGAPSDESAGQLATSKRLASAELYDPVSNTFTATGSMSIDRLYHTATLLADGRVLIAGGQPFGTNAVNSAEIYDPVTGSFTPTGSLSVTRAAHAAARLLDGKVLIAGGFDPAGTIAELFDPATNTFRTVGSMSQNRFFGQAELLADGGVLMLGGAGNRGDLYDPASGNFTATSAAQVNVPWAGGVATARLADGRVLISGGRHRVGVLGDAWPTAPLEAEAELFDPVTNDFTRSGRRSWPREAATATRLVDGRVLIFGGVAHDRWPNRGEVYDPIAATFTATAGLELGRFKHTATLLPNGKVLIAGGRAASSNVVPAVAASSVLFEQY